MHLNDTWGCCTCASLANIVQQQTYFGQKAEIVVPDSSVLAAYEAVGGFNPNAGPPGSNPTDNGATVASAMAYLKKTGMAGHSIAAYGRTDTTATGSLIKIAAYGEVDVTATEKLKTAIWEFGCLSVGLDLPNSAVTQFDNGQPWSVEPDRSLAGGHCVLVVGYDRNGFQLFTWGRLWHMDYEFWSSYGEEAWAPVSTYWVSKASGKDPDGVNLVTLGAEFLAITGQDPFSASRPASAPPPSPAPEPAPAPPPPPVSPPSPSSSGCLGRAMSMIRRLWRY
jgi:papain like protease